MTDTAINNLPELRDIHLPQDGVSFFPLAPGWWIIITLIVGLFVLYKLIRFIRLTSARIYARYLLQPLKQDTSLKTAVKISEILRRICIRKYPNAVALSGDKWIDFLNSHAKRKINGAAAILLQNAPYLSENNKEYSPLLVSEIWNFCYAWIGENL